MGRHSTAIPPEALELPVDVETLTPPESPPSRKRKRDDPTTEIEVDINAPEPPSKKALRKAKKAQSTTQSESAQRIDNEPPTAKEVEQNGPEPEKQSKRSEHGIWIGNLSWMTTKNELRSFFENNLSDEGVSITRIHLPPPTQTSLMKSKQKIHPINKGFAYIDFTTEKALGDALGLSEKLFSGRKVLIKDAKSFEGRPEKPDDASDAKGLVAGKPPGKRIFVGNLGYDTTREEIREHFSQCGEVDDVFLTTFEDSGKCKGYGWVTFAEVEAAQVAVRGWTDFISNRDQGQDEGDDLSQTKDTGDEGEIKLRDKKAKLKKSKKPRKWWINKFQGRLLRMEFAEGKDVRYKKRYGKGGTAAQKDSRTERSGEKTIGEDGDDDEHKVNEQEKKSRLKERKVDARSIKPGAALAAAPRLTGSIVESTGKKTTFE